MATCEGTKVSPRVEEGVIKWYKGDAFYLYFDLRDEDTGGVLLITEKDEIGIEIFMGSRSIRKIGTTFNSEEQVYVCHITKEISNSLNAGEYKYKVYYSKNNGETIQTIENCGDILVEGVCQC